MLLVIESFAFLMVMTLCYQFYRYASSHSGREKQEKCQRLGIFFLAVGITCFALHGIVFVFGGLVLMMFGLRLVSSGLDRIDKKIFIDRYSEDE